MDILSRCLISLGSNTDDAAQNLDKARALLMRAYPGIRFSEPRKTEAIGMKMNQSPFTNQIGLFETKQETDEVKAALKVMERFCGRKPNDKENETIHIDIDLLAYGDTILKPMDFARYRTEIAILEMTDKP